MKAIAGMAATLLGTLLVSGQANAVDYADGNSLLHACAATIRDLNGEAAPGNDSYFDGTCIGIVRGVRDTIDYVSSSLVPGTPHQCIPESINNGQLVRVVFQWLNANPKELDSPGTLLVLMALTSAYPCK